MSQKKRTSLDTIISPVVEDPLPVAQAAAPAAPRRLEPSSPATEDVGIKKHTAYLKTPVYEQLRRLAFEERRKMHDYLIEGLDSVFRARGLPGVAELEKESK